MKKTMFMAVLLIAASTLVFGQSKANKVKAKVQEGNYCVLQFSLQRDWYKNDGKIILTENGLLPEANLDKAIAAYEEALKLDKSGTYDGEKGAVQTLLAKAKNMKQQWLNERKQEVQQQNAAATDTDDMFAVTQNSDNTVTIEKYIGKTKNLVIPSTLYGLPVIGFSETAFNNIIDPKDYSIKPGIYHGTDIRSVVIPDTVTEIPDNAFRNCKSLYRVTIGNGVTKIPDGFFLGCEALSEVTFGSKVTSIGNKAFSGCKKLTAITIPDSVTEIGESAFEASGLTSVTFGKGLKTIGAYAFRGGVEEKEVDRFGGTEYIPTGGITTVTLPAGITSIGKGVFANNRITSVTLPAGITGIGEDAFANNKLTSVTLPAGITSIGSGAFYGNPVQSVTIPTGIKTVGNGIFTYAPITRITLPANVNDSDLVDYGFDSNFRTLYLGQNRAAGTYQKNGPIWARSTAGGVD